MISPISRRDFLGSAVVAGAGCFVQCPPALAQKADYVFRPDENIIPAPDDPARWPEYRRLLAEWRTRMQAQISYDDTLYRRPEFAWAASAYACCFVMMCDETFYDARLGRYTINEFLNHGEREFGGYDSLVLWHAYPRIGVDQRNQFDFYRDMPGGLQGIREIVDIAHRRGVRVYIDYNPWDTGTRREDKSDLDVLVDLVRTLDADGIFLDTMDKGAVEFRAKLDAARPGVVLESEGVPPIERVADHHASWAQHFHDSAVPGVLRHKWFEPRHLQQQIWRWKHDHSQELHTAWMNGSGILVWENVFGSWVQWSARDRSILRLMLPVQRRFTRVFSEGDWTPLVATLQAGCYASLWEAGRLRLWTLVNRNTHSVEGDLLHASIRNGDSFFDLMAGREMSQANGSLSGAIPAPGGTTSCTVAARLPPRGIGCFISAPPEVLGHDFHQFIARQAQTSATYDGDSSIRRRPTTLRLTVPAHPLREVPEGMVEIPSADFTMGTQMRLRECGFYDSNTPDEEGFWSSYSFQTRRFVRPVRLRRYAIDLTPVTNEQFARFVRDSRYEPRFSHNFLRHWVNGAPPTDKRDHPVVWVDLEDARAYARWAGKRLPTEAEWQYAAQGPNGYPYPWGEKFEPNRCNTGQTGKTTPVTAFPNGRSPFGCYDMCGNVWEWTESEHSDGRTRFCIIRGGSWFQAKGSNWYVDGGARPADYATKFLLIWPGLDRCATIGFRCVADLA